MKGLLPIVLALALASSHAFEIRKDADIKVSTVEIRDYKAAVDVVGNAVRAALVTAASVAGTQMGFPDGLLMWPLVVEFSKNELSSEESEHFIKITEKDHVFCRAKFEIVSAFGDARYGVWIENNKPGAVTMKVHYWLRRDSGIGKGGTSLVGNLHTAVVPEHLHAAYVEKKICEAHTAPPRVVLYYTLR